MKIFWTRKQLTAKDKLNILYCHYGSVVNFDCKVQTMAQTARDLNLPFPTIQSAIHQFEANGKNVTLYIAKGIKSGRPRKVIGSKNIEKLLLKGTMLRKLAHMTILERCAFI